MYVYRILGSISESRNDDFLDSLRDSRDYFDCGFQIVYVHEMFVCMFMYVSIPILCKYSYRSWVVRDFAKMAAFNLAE